MHIDLYIVLGSAVVGVLVGMTGAGGGALMTPMLIMLFGVAPARAISSDLVASVLMRPVGSGVHIWAGSVNSRMVLLMSAGSVPAAFLGTWLLSLMGGSSSATSHIETVLGVALLVGAAAIALRYLLDRRGSRPGARRRDQADHGHSHIGQIPVRPLPTFLVGALGGVIVGATSVGAGSLMTVLLLFIYPGISARQLVGTDLTQAVPLTLAAAAGSLIFGTVAFGLTLSLVLGSVPAVFAGSLLSSRVSDRYVKPAIAIVILGSGLKYVGVGVPALGWSLAAVVLLGVVVSGVKRIRSAGGEEPELHATGG